MSEDGAFIYFLICIMFTVHLKYFMVEDKNVYCRLLPDLIAAISYENNVTKPYPYTGG